MPLPNRVEALHWEIAMRASVRACEYNSIILLLGRPPPLSPVSSWVWNKERGRHTGTMVSYQYVVCRSQAKEKLHRSIYTGVRRKCVNMCILTQVEVTVQPCT